MFDTARLEMLRRKKRLHLLPPRGELQARRACTDIIERLFIRIGVAVALCAALLTCALAPIPTELPSPALEQANLYRLEIALMSFYGALMLATPIFAGLVRGRLPIEISTRGARFAAQADEDTAENEAALKALEGSSRQLAQRLEEVQIEIAVLQDAFESDSRQPEVGSKYD
ncbi:MAG TPA: hypothetical protein VFK14_02105 [Solirubrobacterales bacterium]|nr:hypothetical protein [Solirubrobacterales bacterium]